MSKLTSRKFWISVAAFLGSVGTSIAGMQTEQKEVVIAGTICAMLSAAIYAASEAYVDAKATTEEETVQREDVDRSDEAEEE